MGWPRSNHHGVLVMRCAIVKDGIVVNVVEYGDKPPICDPEGCRVVKSDTLNVGATVKLQPLTVEERLRRIEDALGL